MLQTTLIDMEWNTKWDWENLNIFSSKAVAISSPKKLQSTTDWGINEKEDIVFDNSFNLSGVVNIDNNSSAKSSISASTESSFKDNMKLSNFSFEGSRSFHEVNGTSTSLEASVCSSDQSIGLKLGKRTYFENSITKTCSSPNVPVSTVKKVKLSHQNTPIPRCQVEGCNLELSSAKEYHRKHRVCDNHSKSLKVVVGGLEWRFCQQCSRFHGLLEFDGKKRSCRRRLADHNARRRKPPQETFHFNSRNPSSSFYDGQQQQLSFVFNNVQTKPDVSSIWETTCNSRHSVATVKAKKYEDHDGLTRSLGIQFPNPSSMPTIAFNRIMPSMGITAGVFDQGSNAEALDIHRALSLLSNNSWGSHESNFSSFDLIHTNGPTMAQHELQSANHGLLRPSPECWPFDQQSIDPHIHHASTHFEEYHVLKPPYGIQYTNLMDEILKPL